MITHVNRIKPCFAAGMSRLLTRSWPCVGDFRAACSCIEGRGRVRYLRSIVVLIENVFHSFYNLVASEP